MRKKIMFFLEPAFFSKRLVFTILGRSIIRGLSGPLLAILMKRIIDNATTSNFSIVWESLWILIIFYVITDLPSYFFRVIHDKRRCGLKITLYQTYMQRYLKSDNNIIEGLGTGKSQSIIFTGCNSWQQSLDQIIQQRPKLIIGIIGGFLLVGNNLGIKGFLIVVSIFAGSFIFAQRGNKVVAQLRKETRDINIEGDRRFVRMIMAKNEILQNNKVKDENNFIKTHYNKICSLLIRQSNKEIVTSDIQQIIFVIMRIGILGYTIYKLELGLYTVGTITLIWMVINNIHNNITNLNYNITNFHTSKINIDKLRDLFRETPQIKGYDTGKIFIPKSGDIFLDNITYDYGKGDVLRDFSLHIEGGKKTALIGISGSGKSTIIKLIAGYLHTQSGAVRIDNQELPNAINTDFVSLQSYYKHMGYLTQEPSVFDGSIYDNLTYALDHEPTPEEVEKAIQGAQCQFIHEFPEGVQTQIGEKGIKLSGGQRQRLAIAKILLKNPTIILLDEPTSALDSFSEDEVTKALNNLFTGRTVIIIAHRLQTVKHADRIIVLEQGKVVEDGNHESLTKTGGIYAKMLELQSGF